MNLVKNIYMMNYYLLIPVFLILLFLFPIPLMFKTSGNIFKLSAVVVVYICGIKMKGLALKTDIHGVKIYEDKKEIPKNNSDEQKESVYLKQLFLQVKDKMRIQLMQINYNFGVGGAFQSSLIAGWINIFLLILLTRIKSEKPTTSMLVCDNVAYNSTVFEGALMVKARITLFDLVYSLIYSVILMIYIKINKK